MRIKKEEREYPILLAYPRNKAGHLSVWCPYCAHWHHHGKGDGHRIAHCANPHSPFQETGYIIKSGSKKDYVFENGAYITEEYWDSLNPYYKN